MRHISQMRKFVQIVDKLEKNPSDDPAESYAILATRKTDDVEKSKCIQKFSESYSDYSSIVDEICESAIANGYLLASVPGLHTEQRLAVNPLKGRNLLTSTGYVNEMSRSITQLNPVLSLGISFVALVVSIIVLIMQVQALPSN